MNPFSLALSFARRELRSGLAGFRIFLAALTLGVAAIAGVGSLSQAFLTGLEEEGRALLGGDVELERNYQPPTDEERGFLEEWGQVSQAAILRTMAGTPDDPARRGMIELKAVDEAYPLVGAVTLSPAMPLQDALACTDICGAAVEETLLLRLGLQPGAHLRIGDTDVVARATIMDEPDRVSGGFEIGPRVMLSREGLARTGLVREGSLVEYNVRVAFAQPAPAETFRTALRDAFPDAGWEVDDSANAVPAVARFLRQATMFLTLVGLTALIVGGVGAGQAVSAFIERRRDSIATLKAMGAGGQEIFLIYLVQVMAVAGLGIVLGLAAGAALPFAVDYFFGEQIPVPARYAIYPWPLVLAAAFGVLTALGFTVLPLARARDIPPAGLFRDLVAPSAARGRLLYRLAAFGAFAAIAALSIGLSRYPLFNLGFLGGTAVVLVLLRLAGAGLRRAAGRISANGRQSLRLALANLARPGSPSADILVALGLGLTLLATVVLVRSSIDAELAGEFPERAPSFFFIDIQKDQIDPFRALVTSFPTASEFRATPMLRGRITKLKGVPVADANIPEDARWVVDGDRGITYASEKPENADIAEGPDWWPADYSGETLVSFDRERAEEIGLRIGDTITVNVLGRDVDARIYNLRNVDFRGGGINFFMIFSPGVLDLAPHTFLATVRVSDAEEEPMFAAIAKDYANVTVVRVKEALAQVGEMLQALAQGIAAASLITILSGIIVLAGAVAAGHRARLYDAVVLKVLGATRARLAGSYAIEYGALGAAAGLGALVIGTVAAWAVVYFVLDIALVPAWSAAVVTVFGGALCTLVFGLAGGFAALRTKPAARLRNP